MVEKRDVVRVKRRDRASQGTLHPSLQRSNVAIARAVLRALNHPKRRHLGDRALGRRLRLDHKTIGRWRKRIAGGEVPQIVVTTKWLLFACERLATIIPDAVWRQLNHNELASVQKAYVVLHRVFHGGRTLPDRMLNLKSMVKEESCK